MGVWRVLRAAHCATVKEARLKSQLFKEMKPLRVRIPGQARLSWNRAKHIVAIALVAETSEEKSVRRTKKYIAFSRWELLIMDLTPTEELSSGYIINMRKQGQ